MSRTAEAPVTWLALCGAHDSGRREVIGISISEIETEAFWMELLRSLVGRGLSGVRLAVPDDHQGPKRAIEQILGSPWQCCTVHFVRSMAGHCRRSARGLVAAALREIFDATDLEAGRSYPWALRSGASMQGNDSPTDPRPRCSRRWC